MTTLKYTSIAKHRRSGRDAGTQAQGGETIGWNFASIKHVQYPSYRPSPSTALRTGMAPDISIPAGMTTP